MNAKNNAKLTVERVRFLFDYNPTTGDLVWRNPTSVRIAAGDRVGALATNGRRYVGLDGGRYLAHRIAWLYVHGDLPEDNIAARNENYDDLRLDNLYHQSFTETANRNQVRRTNTSGVRGVVWDKGKGKWRAEITRDYQRITLGRFDTREEAQQAYDLAIRARNVKPADPAKRRQHAIHKTRDSQMRRLWRRVLRDNSNGVGWASYAEFCNAMATEIRPHATLAPIRENEIIGPGNYRWVANSAFDTKTTEGRLVYQRHYKKLYPDAAKDSDLRKAFGIGLVEYRQMLAAQNDVCAICKKPEVEMRRGKIPALGVDHCHTTGAIRDLLCIACNSGLARFKDSPEVLRAAADYLEHHASK